MIDTNWDWKESSDPAEECDPKDPNKTWWEDWSGKTCNSACKIEYETPVCSSTYNEKTRYTTTSDFWISLSDNLCDEWSVVNFVYSWMPRVYKWKCKNWEETTDFCTAKQERCGDGVVQEDKESCDPKALAWQNRADGKTCDASCKIVEPAKVNPVCNSTYNNQTKYTTTSAVWLSSSDDLCTKWIVKNFKYSWMPRVFTWDCENDGITTWYTAKQ